MATADVSILGAGVIGLSVAFACARRGAKVRVIDKRGVGAGASGGIVGALAPHTPDQWNAKKAFQFESLMMAEAFWRDVGQLAGEDPGYGRIGRLQPIIDAQMLALAEGRVTSARDLWQGHAIWELRPSADFAHWLPASPTGQVVHDTLSARIHPRRATRALARAVVALGGEMITGTGPLEGAIIEATGYEGLLALNAELDLPVGSGVKGQAMLLAHDAQNAPQLFCDNLHVIPHADGTTAIGSTNEREFDEPVSTDDALDALYARAMTACPALRGASILERWAGVRPRAKTRSPLLGPHPQRPGIYVANGGFKIGFAMAPKLAALMADLVLDGHDAIPPSFRLPA